MGASRTDPERFDELNRLGDRATEASPDAVDVLIDYVVAVAPPALDERAQLRCGGCGERLAGILHRSSTEPGTHPVALCPPCLTIIGRAIRTRDRDELDAAAQRMTVALASIHLGAS